jgi:hypothetical protein
LRRVSGTQLDGELVELFVDVITSQKLAFGHGDDTDFERELEQERASSPANLLPAGA